MLSRGLSGNPMPPAILEPECGKLLEVMYNIWKRNGCDETDIIYLSFSFLCYFPTPSYL